MLYPHLLGQFACKLANKTRIPEFTRNTQVFAAPHQRIGFATLGRRGDAVGIKVLLLTTGYGNEATG
jgi:hypothetical protein